jgi:hypothetical protein
VALPIIAREERIQFLNVHHEQQRNLHVDVNAFARIRESSQRIQQLIHNHHIQQEHKHNNVHSQILASGPAAEMIRQQIPRPNQVARWNFAIISEA